MDLSIVIVSYNVKYFLEQCLLSLQRSCKSISYEIIVVDNASVDQSRPYIAERFPEVIWIQNTQNVGFGRANNQAFEHVRGEYTLILNPDTIVDEHCVIDCLEVMEEKSSIGALGVKMVDGSGKYLPESKRGIPTVWASVSKMLGIYRLAPRTALFNAYYMGELSRDDPAEIEVLSGAFMLCRTKVLKEVGGFDERYFMYAEDIDLSYQIRSAGYRLYYYPKAKVIHFKGESTKKSSKNYNHTFYESMILFMEKYRGELYNHSSIVIFRTLIRGLRVFKYALRSCDELISLIPIYLIVTLCFGMSAWFWATTYHDNGSYFPERLYSGFLPVLSLVWTMVFWVQKRLGRGSPFMRLWRVFVYSTLINIIAYGLLPEEWRFSRAMLLLGSVVTFVGLLAYRVIQHLMDGQRITKFFSTVRSTIVVGSWVSYQKLRDRLSTVDENSRHLGVVITGEGVQFDRGKATHQDSILGRHNEIQSVLETYRPDDVLFVLDDIKLEEVVTIMSEAPYGTDFKLIPQTGSVLLSSGHSHVPGSVLSLDVKLKYNDEKNICAKRIVDVLISSLLILFYPIQRLFSPTPYPDIRMLCEVWIGRKTFVGFDWDDIHLPLKETKSSILNIGHSSVRVHQRYRDVLYYLKYYSAWIDLKIIWDNLIFRLNAK